MVWQAALLEIGFVFVIEFVFDLYVDYYFAFGVSFDVYWCV